MVRLRARARGARGPAGGRALRRRAERAQRRLRERDVVQPPGASAALRRRRRAAADASGRGRGSRAWALVRGATGRRLVPLRRLPPGLDGSGARRLLAGGRRRVHRAGRCRRLPAAAGGRGADPLRFADLQSRSLLPRSRHGAAGAVGARASRPPPGPRGGHLRGLAGPAAGGERPGRRGAHRSRLRARPPGGAGHRRCDRGPPPPAPAAHHHLQPRGDHRAGARRARRARLDGRRVHHRFATPDPLLPHHARRTHRLRLGRRPAGAGRPPERPRGAGPRRGRRGGAPARPLLPGAPGTPNRARLGRPDRRLPDPPARGRQPPRATAFTTPSATPGTGLRPRGSPGASSPRWPWTAATRSPGCRSSSRRGCECRRSRFATPAA